MDLLNETVLLKTKSTLFNLLIREISQFLCYERLLNMTYVAYTNAFFREMQFWSHCYTVVSYQALSRLSVYKIPAVYLLGAKNVSFCTIRDFGSPTISTLVNSDNPNATFHQGLHYLLNKNDLKGKNTIHALFVNYILCPLDITNGLSQIYCIKPEGKIQ